MDVVDDVAVVFVDDTFFVLFQKWYLSTCIHSKKGSMIRYRIVFRIESLLFLPNMADCVASFCNPFCFPSLVLYELYGIVQYDHFTVQINNNGNFCVYFFKCVEETTMILF